MKPRKCSNPFFFSAFVSLCLAPIVLSSPPLHLPSQVQVNTQDYCRSVGRALGRCVPLQDCALFSNWLKQRPVLKQNVKTVVKFTCYFDIKSPKVCCPLPEIANRDELPSSYNLIQDHFGLSEASVRKQSLREQSGTRLLFPDELEMRRGTIPSNNNNEVRHGTGFESKHNLLPLLEECGNSLKLSRHVGTFGAYPWIAMLGNKDSSGNWVHVCSGTLINKNYVLSNAHCFNKDVRYPITHIRLGEYDTGTRIDRGSPFLPDTVFQEYSLQEAVIHPSYDSVTGEDDIALGRIVEDVTFSNHVRPICLPLVEHYGLSKVWGSGGADRKLLVAGWGRLHLNSTGYRTLQEAQVRLTPSQDCTENLGFSPSKQSCVGGNYRDNLCLGDDGSGLMMPLRLESTQKRGGATPKVFQTGVFSSGPSAAQCQTSTEGTEHRLVLLRQGQSARPRSASPGNVPLPGVYTKVIPYLDWILEKMQP